MSTIFTLTCLLSLALSADWDYSDQDTWSGSCNVDENDTQQSPININTRDLHECDTSTPSLDWNVSNIETIIVKNVQSHYTLKFELVSDEHPDKHGVLRNNFVTSSNEHTAYILHHAHIHWKSEHVINGRRSALEVHFVHYSADYNNISQALAATPSDTYSLSVVGVLFDIGKKSDFFAKIIGNDDFDKLRNGNSIEIDDVQIDQLLPFVEGDEIPYHHYKGSLTTPPCSPIVNWIVLKEKMSISRSQLKSLRSVRDLDGKKIKRNFRNLQEIVNDVHLCNDIADSSSSGKYSASSSSDSDESGRGRHSAEMADKTQQSEDLISSHVLSHGFLADFGTILLIVVLSLVVAFALGAVFYCHYTKRKGRKSGHTRIKNEEDEDDDLECLEEGKAEKEITDHTELCRFTS